MMQELKLPVSALAVAKYYSERYPDLLSGFLIDDSDASLQGEIGNLGMEVTVTNTIMRSRDEKQKLAQTILRTVGLV